MVQGGPVAPPTGDRAGLPYLNPAPLSPLILLSKLPEKIEKKERGEKKESGEALPKCASVICRY